MLRKTHSSILIIVEKIKIMSTSQLVIKGIVKEI